MEYKFIEISKCEMCADSNTNHHILGQRMNKSQGINPKNNIGITVSVQQCTNCGLIYSNPRPEPMDFQKHYGTPPESYWKPEYFEWTSEYFQNEIAEVKQLLKFERGMTALDIGAGIGKGILSLEAAGFNTFGLEPSIPFYEKAISTMHIKPKQLKLGKIEDLNYRPNSFDFITFGAVYEHLAEPAKCLAKALSWLKPNGIIHIEVPSSAWLMSPILNFYFKLKGTNYVTNLSPLHAPFHLYEFHLQSFEKLSKILDFSIAKKKHAVCQIYFMPRFLHPFLKWYMKKTARGMQLTVYLRKNG